MTNPTSLRHGLPLPLVTAATTWLVMLSWKGFSTVWGSYLGPLLLVGLVVAVLGVALRLSSLPRRVAALIQVLAVAALVWLLLGGVVWHPISSTGDIVDSLNNAWTSSSTYAPPIPASVPGIAPIMIPSGALSLLVVDFLACWLRRVSLAGLPLLAVYCVPISLLGGGVSWVIFLLAAVGFMVMMVLQETEHVARWGRPLGSSAGSDPYGFGVNTGASRATATTVGTVSAVLAIVLPIFIPTLHLGSLGLFGPGGPGGGVKVINPITDMRRDLTRGKDVPLLDIKTNDPDPSYFRIAVLTTFNGVEWSTGNRAIVSDQIANGIVPLPQGLGNVPMTSHQYAVTATSDFDSTWLPTAYPVISVEAAGDWHYDKTTMDFISGNSQTNAAGLSYTMTGVTPKLSAYSMLHSIAADTSIQSVYTALPTTLPPIVRQLAERVTRSAGGSRYRAAVLLQNWFREKGGFRYSLKTNPGDGNDALAQFLTKANGGRVGYCEQFASAFAAMARSLEIPTRVAIGFLQPTRAANGDWIYSAHDLHAWPEVYFRGSGWVRFEPTPGSRTGAVPAYTTGPVSRPHTPSGGITSRKAIPSGPTATSLPKNKTTTTTSSTSHGARIPWLTILVVVVVLAVLALLALVPRAVRRSRRRRRLVGGVEDMWDELRDSALDLGVRWPYGRSPHDTGSHLVGWFGPEPDGPPAVRPPRGPGLAPGAEDALDRLVLTLERVRYSRSFEDVRGALAEDLLTCVAALEHGSTRSSLRKAQWLPVSLIGHEARAAAAEREREPQAASRGGLVDHVG